MVIHRMVNRLRERPAEERVAVAGSIALGVVGILLIGWVAFFLHGIGGGETVQAVVPVAPAGAHSVIAPSSDTRLQWDATAATGTEQNPQTAAQISNSTSTY